MQYIRFSLALAVFFALHSVANANFGPAQPAEAIALYDVVTGEITVSVDGVNNWFLQSISSSFTGDAPVSLPAAGGLVTDNDSFIGETHFGLFSYTGIGLGAVAVAAIGLPFGDLSISWNAGLGRGVQTQDVYYSNVPYVHAFLGGPIVIDLATDPLNITLDASNSFGSDPGLQFSWDLDISGDFEISTGTIPTLEIADVVATFGGVGVYYVDVRSSILDDDDRARTSVTIINTPEPTALALAGLGIAVVATMRRRRSGLHVTCS